MTEYQQMNGTVQDTPESYESARLEDSVVSLLTQELQITDEQTIAANLYRKAAKLFVNKKFVECYEQCNQLKNVVTTLGREGKVNDEIVTNTWCLFFNVVDIILTKGQGNATLERELLSNDWFEQLYEMDGLVDPKLVYLLTLIKLHNEKTDLAQLRQQVEMYMMRLAGDDTTSQSVTELHELYLLDLLFKMGEFEEIEHMIKMDTHLQDPDAVLKKFQEKKLEFERQEQRRKDDAEKKKKEALAKKKEKQMANDRAREKQMLQELEKAKEVSIGQQKKEKESKALKRYSQQSSRTAFDIVKRRLSFFMHKNTIMAIFTLIGLVVALKANPFMINPKLRRWTRAFWEKLGSTVEMALKVTYM